MISQAVSHYRLINHLGSGGMGEVYLAEDLRLGRKVALKLLKADFTSDEVCLRLFDQEARAASALSHPNIVTIFDIGQEGSAHFIATEFVDGRTLRSQRLKIDEALDVAIQVASALDAAHAAGITHCDIKPENIMRRADGLVKVLDFGLARLTRSEVCVIENETPVAIKSGVDPDRVTGTAGYMSPEQVRGQVVDARADIFSLGVVLYELIAGRMPFEGQNPSALLQAILDYEPPPLAAFCDDAPLALERIVRRALEKDRAERYQSAREMLDDLKRLKNQIDVATPLSAPFDSEAVQSPIDHRPASVARNRRWLLAIAFVIGFALAIDLSVFKPQGGARIRDACLLLVAVACLTRFITLGRKTARLDYLIPKGAAFRGLLPFQEADRNRFYGREADTHALFDRVSHNEFRFGILFGDSGSGKTSLVRAALLPKLWEAGFMPIYCRLYKDPVGSVVEECSKRSQIAPRQEEDPARYILRVCLESGATVVIVCDQFEEFFVNFKTRRERESFISFVTACHNSASAPVKFLFAMRSDFLYLVNEFEGRIPEPLMSSKLYHLRNFDEEQAEVIIEKSARRASLPFEKGLSRQVARDLATADTVLPSELQIVGEQLQNKRIYTAQEYRRAGGKESLVHSFLEDVIRGSGDQESARLLLRSLISDENTRLTLPLDEISRRTQRSGHTVERILNILARARLVREIQEDDPWRYELMHEYLIERINQITGKVMDATQRANRLLKQYLSNYAVDRRTRIPFGKLWFIRRYSDVRRGEREQELLRKSLRWGLAKTGAILVLLAVGITIATATVSVTEEWEGFHLRDGHTKASHRVVFSPDGRLLVSAGDDSKLIVWDFARRERIASLEVQAKTVTSVAFSPDAKWIASSDDDGAVIVWDAARLEKVVALSDHQTTVASVDFSPDGKYLLSSSIEPTARAIVYEVGRWAKVRELPIVAGAGYFLFSPDGRTVIEPNTFTCWDLATGRQVAGDVALEHSASRSAISSDGMRLISMSDRDVAFLMLASPANSTRYKLLHRQQAHKLFARAAAFSPDDRLAATGADDIVLWDVASMNILARMEHTDNVWSLAFSPDGRWLVSTHGDGAILLWDIAQRKRAANFNEHSAAVNAVAFSTDGKYLASAGEDQHIIIWNVEQNRKEAVLIGHEHRVLSLAFSPGSEWLVASDSSGKIILWDVARRSPRWSSIAIDQATLPDFSVAASPDWRWVASTWSVYDSADGREVFRMRDNLRDGQTAGNSAIAFSPDGRWLACVSWFGRIRLWDTQTWEVADEFNSRDKKFIRVSFSSDSRRLATGDVDGSVSLWEIEPIRSLGLLGKHGSHVQSVAFSPDGSEVASASDDQTIAIWDTGRRGLVTRVGSHTAPVLSVAFSPDGKRLASGGQDKSVRIYTRHRSLWGYSLD
jgi:WD40 repeat protein